MPHDHEGEAHWVRWKAFSLEAYASFQTTLEQIRSEHAGLSSYEVVDKINSTRGTFAWWWGAASEVQESINSLNAWGVRLHEWSAWNEVIDSYEEETDRWDILHHFLEPLVFFCMLQPSSFADRLAITAENLLHQANRKACPEEPDKLVQDDLPGRPLRRSDRRKQLGRLGRRWAKFEDFERALRLLDGDEYTRLTNNYRNLAAHSFSPRLLLGQIRRSIRSIVPFSEMVKQADGTHVQVDHPTKKSVSYAMTCEDPLSLPMVHNANLAEYQRAKKAMTSLTDLIEELCASIGSQKAD